MRSFRIGIVLLFGVVSAVFFIRQDQQSSVIQIIQSDCHFEQGHCRLELSNDLTLDFKFTPIDIPVMEPFYLTITGLEGLVNADHLIKVWFEGRDMSMGQHFMLPDQEADLNDDAISNNRLILRGIIPVCAVDNDMIWRLVVELPQMNNERQQIHFELL